MRKVPATSIESREVRWVLTDGLSQLEGCVPEINAGFASNFQLIQDQALGLSFLPSLVADLLASRAEMQCYKLTPASSTRKRLHFKGSLMSFEECGVCRRVWN